MRGYWVRVKSDLSIDRLLAERNVRPAQVRGPRDRGDERQWKKEGEKGGWWRRGNLQSSRRAALSQQHSPSPNAEPAFCFDVNILRRSAQLHNIRITFLQFVSWVSAWCRTNGSEDRLRQKTDASQLLSISFHLYLRLYIVLYLIYDIYN